MCIEQYEAIWAFTVLGDCLEYNKTAAMLGPHRQFSRNIMDITQSN